ncbi:claudin-2 [Bombina bombina]|uniref:claudin-2 n=1 Tax=Bombina bombina TaxID=8345 RepID=UPI00235AC40D|nr:claudin-2 [Bombina bombina]
MVSVGLQMVGYFLAFLGLIGTIVATLLPNWKVLSYVGTSIVTAVGLSKGLWMECATQSTGMTQCDIYNSMLGLPADTQAAQALMVTSCVLSVLASLLSIFGMRCTIFSQGSPGKDKIAITGGAIFVTAGVLSIIPICWNLHSILQEFYNPLLSNTLKFEMGPAIYLGILASILSVVGGGILCGSCPSNNQEQDFYSRYKGRVLASDKGPAADGLAQNSEHKKRGTSGYSLTGYV